MNVLLDLHVVSVNTFSEHVEHVKYPRFEVKDQFFSLKGHNKSTIKKKSTCGKSSQAMIWEKLKIK